MSVPVTPLSQQERATHLGEPGRLVLACRFCQFERGRQDRLACSDVYLGQHAVDGMHERQECGRAAG